MSAATKTTPPRKMLDQWAANIDDRRTIEEFLDWLDDKYPELERVDMHRDKLLDEFHSIDRKQLDKERRALLEQQREANQT